MAGFIRLWSMILLINGASISLYGINLVTIQFKPLPPELIKQLELDYQASDKTASSAISASLPSQSSIMSLKAALQKTVQRVDGVQVFYAGINAFSDTDGIVQFTIQHKDPVIKIIITEDFSLTKVRSNTIAEQTFSQNTKPLALYHFERKEDQSIKTKDANSTRYWQVTKQPNPNRTTIDKAVFIVLGNPDNFYIPEGDFMTEQSQEQIIVPAIYITNSTHQNKILLDSLDNERYHRQPEPFKEQKTDSCTVKLRQYALSKILQASRWLF